MLISHDLGCHIGPYGRAREQTPTLNQFAADGVRLDQHFVSSPGCSQSRSSFVTGRYPHSNGQFGLANWGWKLNEDEVLLPQVLRDSGYDTALFGVWHLHEWTLGSFDSISDDVSVLDTSPEGFAEIASHRAADWLHGRPTNADPFYLHIGFWEVHRPFCGTPEERAAVTSNDCSNIVVPDYLPDNEPTRREFAELMRSISVVDDGVDRVLKALNDTGLADNTLVLFTADHGLPFARAKGTLYDPGINVACMARWPGRIAGGSVSGALTSNVDIMPTLLDAARVPIPDSVQGSSRLDLLCGRPPNGVDRSSVFAEKTYHEHYDPIRCVRTARHKYIRNFAARPMLVLPSDVYNSPSRQSSTDDESLWSHRPQEEFYDLVDDPDEIRNLAGDPAIEDLLKQARRQLSEWMEQTDDPLRHGPISRVDARISRNDVSPLVVPATRST